MNQGKLKMLISIFQGFLVLLAGFAASPEGQDVFQEYTPVAVVVIGLFTVLLNEGGPAFRALLRQVGADILERGPAWVGGAFAHVVDDVEEAFRWEIPDSIEVTARKIVEAGVVALGYFYDDKAGFADVDASPQDVVKAGAKQLGLKVEITNDGEVVKVKKAA